MTIGSYNINDISAYASIELNMDVKNPFFANNVKKLPGRDHNQRMFKGDHGKPCPRQESDQNNFFVGFLPVIQAGISCIHILFPAEKLISPDPFPQGP
jgi:hypothetical protein